jgi:acetyl esterase/lipase
MAGHGLMNPIDPRFNASVLDPDFVKYYNESIATKPFTHQAPLAEIRANPKKWAPLWDKDYSDSLGVKNISIELKDGHKLKLRTYTPDEEKSGKGPYPVHINYHGGGFIFGDLDMDGEWCMRMRNEVGILIVDVDYRRMPGKQYQSVRGVLRN